MWLICSIIAFIFFIVFFFLHERPSIQDMIWLIKKEKLSLLSVSIMAGALIEFAFKIVGFFKV